MKCLSGKLGMLFLEVFDQYFLLAHIFEVFEVFASSSLPDMVGRRKGVGVGELIGKSRMQAFSFIGIYGFLVFLLYSFKCLKYVIDQGTLRKQGNKMLFYYC